MFLTRNTQFVIYFKLKTIYSTLFMINSNTQFNIMKTIINCKNDFPTSDQEYRGAKL